MILDPEERLELIRTNFHKHGVSVKEWANRNNFSVGLVYQILNGKRKCFRGQSHEIAAKLGLKP